MTQQSITHRRIAIYCDGRDACGHGLDHQEVIVGALVSVRGGRTEAWDGEPGPHLRHESPDLSPVLREHPLAGQDLDVMALSGLATWFEIKCPRCSRNFRSGDLLGTGFETAAARLSKMLSGQRVPQDDARVAAKREAFGKLSRVADSGVSRLSLSAVAAILEPLPKR